MKNNIFLVMNKLIKEVFAISIVVFTVLILVCKTVHATAGLGTGAVFPLGVFRGGGAPDEPPVDHQEEPEPKVSLNLDDYSDKELLPYAVVRANPPSSTYYDHHPSGWRKASEKPLYELPRPPGPPEPPEPPRPLRPLRPPKQPVLPVPPLPFIGDSIKKLKAEIGHDRLNERKITLTKKRRKRRVVVLIVIRYPYGDRPKLVDATDQDLMSNVMYIPNGFELSNPDVGVERAYCELREVALDSEHGQRPPVLRVARVYDETGRILNEYEAKGIPLSDDGVVPEPEWDPQLRERLEEAKLKRFEKELQEMEEIEELRLMREKEKHDKLARERSEKKEEQAGEKSADQVVVNEERPAEQVVENEERPADDHVVAEEQANERPAEQVADEEQPQVPAEGRPRRGLRALLDFLMFWRAEDGRGNARRGGGGRGAPPDGRPDPDPEPDPGHNVVGVMVRRVIPVGGFFGLLYLFSII
jgi:hypothetical protein